MANYKQYSDQIIFRARDIMKEKFGENIFDFVDHYPLFACPQTMLRYQSLHDLLKSVLSIPGDIYEFGTWKGASAVYFAKLLNEFEPQSDRKIYVFDNFSGLPEPSFLDGSYASSQVGGYKGNLDSLRFIIKSFDLEHRISLIEGDANVTVPKFFSDKQYLHVALAYFDFDLYKPTINTWKAIKNNMAKSSVIVFDEGLDYDMFVGECIAAKEILDDLKSIGRVFRIENNKIAREPQLIVRLDQ